jgi:hypothetical protein
MRSVGAGPGAGSDADVTTPSLADLPPDTFDRLVAP